MTDRYENIRKVLTECRDIAMEWTLRGRIPECGKFGEIAQDLDAVCSELETTDPERAQQPAAVDAGRAQRIQALVGGVEVDLKAPLQEQLAESEHAAAAQAAEIEALRAEVAAWRELSDHVRVGACAAIWPDRYTDARTRDVAAALKRADRLAEALRRYRNEVPLGHQPHMLAHEVDDLLREQEEWK